MSKPLHCCVVCGVVCFGPHFPNHSLKSAVFYRKGHQEVE